MLSRQSLFSTAKNSYGSLLTPVSCLHENIKISDLIANKQEIFEYLEMVSANQPKEKILEQPTPAGMALIANYYNNKKDQFGIRIYIASTIEDLQHFAAQINLQESEKAIVIFQPTDYPFQKINTFYAIHKVVVYFEKQPSNILVLIEDSTPFVFIRQTTIDFLEKVLNNTPRTYYTQKVLKQTEDENPIIVQGDYWNCGTHAFRLARLIAKNPQFIQELNITHRIISSDNTQKSFVEYMTPIKFLKLADTKIARSKCRSFFGKAFDEMNSHFVRYEKDFSYIKHFTRKYLSLLATFVVNESSQQLLQQIKENDAKNYSIDDNYSITNNPA